MVGWIGITAKPNGQLRARSSKERSSTTGLAAVQLILADYLGREFVFDNNVADLKRLRERVEEYTLKHLLPPALEAVREGGIVSFGPVSVSQEGLQIGAEQLPWERYDRGEAARGRLTIYAVGQSKPFCKVATADVPNSHVLLALADAMRDERG
jgi:hypothetical protein